MKIKITTDSACDLGGGLLERNGVTAVPLHVLKDGADHLDGVTVTPGDIFRHVERGGDLCTTAAVNVRDYEDCFGDLSARYDAVIHISIGSGFSSSFSNACAAAQAYGNVRVVDSKNLSTGQGLLVLEAAEMARSGAGAEGICARLGTLCGKVETSFLVSRLDYLRNGGRCSLAAALGANILHLRPCIDVKDGKMQATKKYRGSFARCLEAYGKERLAGREDILRDRAFITYAEVPEPVLEAVRDAVREYGRFREVLETRAGCAVSCHCGPGTLGILFLRK
ncbi:MAG TPA: DegV family protein [Oscillospiraceae bacterium]|nr:DegV family protein [Oscillospiraceae bacterium]